MSLSSDEGDLVKEKKIEKSRFSFKDGMYSFSVLIRLSYLDNGNVIWRLGYQNGYTLSPGLKTMTLPLQASVLPQCPT